MNQPIQLAVKPLRLIFWGSLLCVLDFTFSKTVNGRGWKFDLLNDFIGVLMILWGVYRLRMFQVHDRYRKTMLVVFVVALIETIAALHEHRIYRIEPVVSFLQTLLDLVSLFALMAFCLSMRWLCENSGLECSAASWRTTLKWFFFIYLIPLGLFHLAALLAQITGQGFHINLGAGYLLLLVVLIVPLVHFFISTSRMQSEAVSGESAHRATSERRTRLF